MRGLAQLRAAQAATGMQHPLDSDIGAALTWVGLMADFKSAPRRRGAMPKHLQKLFKKPRRRRRS
jgi:hypothetical protein